jgi:hypothetical protein
MCKSFFLITAPGHTAPDSGERSRLLLYVLGRGRFRYAIHPPPPEAPAMQRLPSNSVRRIATSLVALALVALAAAPVQAQRYGGPPLAQRAAYSSISAGLRAGLNVATLYGDDVSEAGARTGFSGGLFLTYSLTPIVAIQPEILFSAKGAEIDRDGFSPMGVGEREYTFGYLELPMLARVNVPLRSAARPYLIAGPALAIKLYGDLDEEDLGESLKGSDLGVVVGGGLDVGLGARRVVLDARYTFGLNDVFDVVGDPEAKNGALTISVGVGL